MNKSKIERDIENEEKRTLTQGIIAIILEDVNGCSKEEAKKLSKQHNGETENKIFELIDNYDIRRKDEC